MKPTVSIIIPIYNAEATLDRCLESILTQSLRDIEVICVLDGSTDGSAEILSRWADKDERVHAFGFEKNYGIVQAMKVGLRESKGEYVMFADADDRLLPGACENLVRLIRKYDVDILRFGIKVNVQPGLNEAGWQSFFASNEWTSEGVNILYDCFSMRRIQQHYWNKIYRGDVCRTAGAAMPDLKLTQAGDMLQAFFFFYYAKTFRSVPDGPYYEYFIGNGISTRAANAERFAALCATSAIVPALERFLQKENALENNRFLLDAINNTLKSTVISELMILPNITRETVRLTVENWGTDVLYSFIKQTGLLDIKCESRYQMVQTLMDEIRKRNKKQI